MRSRFRRRTGLSGSRRPSASWPALRVNSISFDRSTPEKVATARSAGSSSSAAFQCNNSRSLPAQGDLAVAVTQIASIKFDLPWALSATSTTGPG